MHRPHPCGWSLASLPVLVLACVLFAFPGSSSANSYWYPLSAGTHWIYSDGTVTLTVEVGNQQIRAGQNVHAVSYVLTGLVTNQPTAWTWYTMIDDDGIVRHVGCRPESSNAWYEFAPAWAWLKLPPAEGDTWGEADLMMVTHHGKDSSPGSGWYQYSWDQSGTVTTPAGRFTGCHSSHGWVAPMVGQVTFRLPPAYLHPGELLLVESSLVVPASDRSWSALKERFR